MTYKDAKLWFEGVYLSIKGQGYEDKNEEAYKKAIDALGLMEVLEKVYKCPSELLDKDKALDDIMYAYKMIRPF